MEKLEEANKPTIDVDTEESYLYLPEEERLKDASYNSDISNQLLH